MRHFLLKNELHLLPRIYSVMLIISLMPMWMFSCCFLKHVLTEHQGFSSEAYCESIPFRMKLLEYYSSVQSLLHKSEIADFACVKDAQGNLHYSCFYSERDADIFLYAQRLARLNRSVSEKGTRLLFVMPPGKYDLKESSDENLWLNDPSKKVEELLFYLSRLGVDVLDLTDMEASFYKTDHHWTVSTAFEATKCLVQTIYEKYGDNLDATDFYLNPLYFEKKHYEDNMLGSMGRKTGISFSGTDDFSVFFPKYPMYYERTVISEKGEETMSGDILQTLVKLQYLDEPNIYERSSYSAYLDGIKTQNKIVNLMARNHRTALIVQDSYFSPVVCFLAPMFWKIDTVYNLEVGKSVRLESLISENTYDYILFEVYPFNIHAEAFQFFEEELP